MDFSRPGKPTDGTLRRSTASDGSAYRGIDLDDAERSLRRKYNNFRPHGSLDRSTPALRRRRSLHPGPGSARKLADLVDPTWGQEHDDILRTVPLVPTVVLAEGRSDINILKRSLSILFPERQDYFSFFEHAELNVDGGAAYLVKFLKAFAAARAPLRLVAIFDNDTAGRQAHRQAQDLGLPDNMILLRLPDTDLAGAYPTIGPQGFHSVDVNGKAASIELYLGRIALTVNGQLRRVRWTGYDKAANAYQGEVEAKDDIKQHFFRELDSLSLSTDAQEAFPELVDVWNAIFAAVELSAEAAQRKTVSYSWRDT